MNSLSQVPPRVVLQLHDIDVPRMAEQARSLQQRFLHADCGPGTNKESVLAIIAKAFDFPAHFGSNLDALFDCVSDLEADASAAKPGFTIVLNRLPDVADFNGEERERLLDVFRDAADYFADTDTQFRVFYSLVPDVGEISSGSA